MKDWQKLPLGRTI